MLCELCSGRVVVKLSETGGGADVERRGDTVLSPE